MKKRKDIPPNAQDIEEIVLGALMIDNKAADEVVQRLNVPGMFYEPKHQHIFNAIHSLYEKNEPIDISTVSHRLKAMGTFDMAGGDFYLIQLTKKIASSAHIDHHSRILIQESGL